MFATPLRLLLFVPTLLYRFSLKASALTYAPLFFAIEGPVVVADDPKRTCEYEQSGLTPRLQRGWAFLTLVFLIVKFLAKTLMTTGHAVEVSNRAVQATNQVGQATNQTLLAIVQIVQDTNPVVTITVPLLDKLPSQNSPRFIYPWEIASAMVILLTFMTYGLTKQTLWKHRDDLNYSFDTVSRVVRGSARIRTRRRFRHADTQSRFGRTLRSLKWYGTPSRWLLEGTIGSWMPGLGKKANKVSLCATPSLWRNT